jgi:hypothetical protein
MGAGVTDAYFSQIRISSDIRYSADFTPERILQTDTTTEVLWDFSDATTDPSGTESTVPDASGNGYSLSLSINAVGGLSTTCPIADLVPELT